MSRLIVSALLPVSFLPFATSAMAVLSTTTKEPAAAVAAAARDAAGNPPRSKPSERTAPVAGKARATKPSPKARLLFKSGFEGSINLGAPAMYGVGAWQDISGTDSQSGFAWPPKIWNGSGRFQLIAGSNTQVTSASLRDYMYNEFQTVTGHNGTPTRALYSTVLKSGNGNMNTGSNTQNVLHVLPSPNGQGDLYTSMWLKLQPDFLSRFPNNWATRMVTDWKTSGDYRITLQIVVRNDPSFRTYWRLNADNDANGGLPYQEFFGLENTYAPIPVGEWFRVEQFVHRSGGADGRVWVAINGKQIFNRLGSNMGINNKPWNRIMPFINYSTNQVLPAYQWVDDLEIWNGFPSTASPH